MNPLPDRLRWIGRGMILDTRSYLGQYPFLFGCIEKIMPGARSHTLVTSDTQVCIEAPPGSGNSYFVNGFRMVNEGVRLAHHQHVAAQVKRGVRMGVPTLTILRDPVDCVVSRAWHSPRLFGVVFRQWIRFYRAVEEDLASVLIASFESVTRRPELVVEALNARFGTSFNTRFPDADEVFAQMDAAYAAHTGGRARRNPNRPDRNKQQLKEQVRPQVETHAQAAVARMLYAKLLERAV